VGSDIAFAITLSLFELWLSLVLPSLAGRTAAALRGPRLGPDPDPSGGGTAERDALFANSQIQRLIVVSAMPEEATTWAQPHFVEEFEQISIPFEDARHDEVSFLRYLVERQAAPLSSIGGRIGPDVITVRARLVTAQGGQQPFLEVL